MPRNEGFLDPETGPVASFAWDLRLLREKAGKVPYRVLAKRAGFCASTLSVAASGAKLPSLDVTLAYVQACGGDPDTWRERWHALAVEHLPPQPGPNAQPQPGLQVAPPYDADEQGEPAPPEATTLHVPPDSSHATDRELPMAAVLAIAAEHEAARTEPAAEVAAPPTRSAHRRLRGGRPWRSGLRAPSLSRVATIVLAFATVALGLRVMTSEGAAATPVTGPAPPVAASPTPAETAIEQADALYALIYQVTPWRSGTGTNDAIWDVSGCRNLSNAQSKLRSIARGRQQQIEALATLDVSKIPDSTQLVAALKQAWLTSAQSDTAYANIAADLQTGCTTGAMSTDPNYQQADAYAQAAAAAKSDAVRLWNKNADALVQLKISGAQL